MAAPANQVSHILLGSWRSDPDTISISEAPLAACVDVLTSTGAGGLAWNRIKGNPSLAMSLAGQEIRQYAQLLVLEAARYETALAALVRLCQDTGFAPLHFKGWVAAQYYGEPHLRAMGDADICAPPGRFEQLSAQLRAEGFREVSRMTGEAQGKTALLASPDDWPGKRLLVDLHERLDKFCLEGLEAVFDRAKSVPLCATTMLTPAPEDHLRIVTMHFLRDGGWRPSALCDVAAMLESLPGDFDWDLALNLPARQHRWFTCTFALAQALLGARLDDAPAACRFERLPSWLRTTVLRAWEKPMSHHGPRVPFHWFLRHDRRFLLTEALARWPDGIRASVELDTAFTDLPRWPYQLLFFLRSMARFAGQVSRDGAKTKFPAN